MYMISFRHFFELVRFDFVLDDTGKVYLMEVGTFQCLQAP